jgi:hypothetical protein
VPRPMSSDMLTAIQANQLYPAIFIQAQFRTGTIHIWSGYGSLSWNSQTWVGVGSLGGGGGGVGKGRVVGDGARLV